MSSGDSAIVQARWIRRDFEPSSERARLVVGYHVENTGTNVWDDLTYFVRAHLVTRNGYVRDPLIDAGNVIPSTVAPEERFDGALAISSSDDVAPEVLLDPATIVIVNVVQEGVEWISGPAGVIAAADALDPCCQDFVARAARAGFVSQEVLNTVVPTDPFGPRGVVLAPAAAPDGHTLYFVAIDFAVSGSSTQRVVARWTPREDGVERIVGTWQLPPGTTPIDLGLQRVGPGDSFRMDAEPNEDGGGINGNIRYIDLPWLERPTA